MIRNAKVVVVMPAFNAAKTLEKTVRQLDRTIVDIIILVDDGSQDETVKVATRLGLAVSLHDRNRGYGANQKTCYRLALDQGADIIVMVHPDYQYDPKLVPAMAHLINTGIYDVVLGSRILGKGALRGGMPKYKYVANRVLTAIQNILAGEKLSEYHTGYRAFSRDVLESLPLGGNSDDFVFDSQILCQTIAAGYRIGEISCPTKYFPEASSINLTSSIIYGLGVLKTSTQLALFRMGLKKQRLFEHQTERDRAAKEGHSQAPPNQPKAH